PREVVPVAAPDVEHVVALDHVEHPAEQVELDVARADPPQPLAGREVGVGRVLRHTRIVAQVSLVVHGHFYQPPRENPWTETVGVEPTAAPFHDWNERVTAECYRPNGWARVVDEHERVV